jgi:hypothetical protein
MVDLSSFHEAAILNGLTEPDLEKIGAIAYEKETRKGERLFSRGMDADTFYIVKEGRFALTVMLRVSFWTHTKTSTDWETAVRPSRKHSFSSRKSSGLIGGVSAFASPEPMRRHRRPVPESRIDALTPSLADADSSQLSCGARGKGHACFVTVYGSHQQISARTPSGRGIPHHHSC